MKRVILVHRWSGGPEDDWRPWLKTQLQAKGYEVIVPLLPNTEVPVIEKWVNHLAQVVGTPDSETYFIGHSIGCQTILRYLETISTPVGGAVFVAGWFDLKNLEGKEVEQIAHPWTSTPIDLQKITSVLPQSTLIISDNDPFDAFKFNKEKFAELGSKIVVIPGAGHFTGDDGFTELPSVMEEAEEWAK